MEVNKQPILRFWGKKRVPLILQSEAAECGLACVAMVASYWGHQTDLRLMRQSFSISLKGSTLKGIMTIAGKLDLKSRPIRVDLLKLNMVKLPCVLHWDMNHFVVLTRVDRGFITVNDPAFGEKTVSVLEAGKHFTGVALELEPTERFVARKTSPRVKISDLTGRISGVLKGWIVLASLGVGIQLCLTVTPFLMQWVVDQVLVSKDIGLLWILVIGFSSIAILQALLTAIRTWFTASISANISFQWFGNVFSHLMQLPLTFFENRHLGDIVSRFGAIQTIQKSITTQAIDALLDGMLSIFIIFVMFFYSSVLTSISVGALVLYALLREVLYRPLKERARDQVIYTARQQTHFFESSRGIQSIKLFNRASERRVGWMNMLADQTNAELSVSKLNIVSQFSNNVLFSLDRILIICIGARLALNNEFTAGMLIAFVGLKEQLTTRASTLIDKFFEFRMLSLHSERLADIVMTEAETEDLAVRDEEVSQVPSLELRNISYRYSDDEPFVLKDVNLTVSPGQCVAITGVSGGGKTTLLKILLGLLKPTAGEVLIDGIPLSQIGISKFREMIGTVMQDDTLFSGSIRDNISFFDPDLDSEQIEAAARQAAVHDDIKRMPMGYATLIGGIGTGLSGGQKQRVLLARALYRRPKILYLDEATSNLDIGNEKIVNEALRSMRLTRVLVAHRPETISMAERVVIVEKGTVSESHPTFERSSVD
ncbi:ATP-binding cassette subfamily B protein RaxB [Paraburkholderia sp. GAS206C]|uniref:peptidase domain-containing ABC transporter n=1 Tax=unclassified Paraburkholderia TaxID=2615204 RepID=UPI003D198214